MSMWAWADTISVMSKTFEILHVVYTLNYEKWVTVAASFQILSIPVLSQGM